MGQQQKMMLYVMPLMYVFFGLSIPIGVLVYWTVSNLWSLGQQYVIIRSFPTPGTPAYVEWEDRMVAKGRDPHAIERARADKARRRPAASTSRTPVKVDDSGRPVVARQGVNRQTVRTNGSEHPMIARQQIHRSSRAARKRST